MAEHIIFNSEIDFSNLEDLRKEYAEIHDLDVEEIPDSEVFEYAQNSIDYWFEDELDNLDKRLNGNILVIASLGLWNGRRAGYKEVGNNLNEVLKQAQGDYYKVYCDKYNVVAEDGHHDGTNYYTFREIKDGVNIDLLKDKIYNGTFTNKDITRYTKSLRPYVKDIFGF